MSRGGLLRSHLSADDFRLLRDLVYEHAGLHFDDDSHFLFERRLSERVEALGLDGFHAYYKFLRFNAYGPSELEEATERLTTKETYFFRQEYQLRAFKDELLPRLSVDAKDRRRLTFWSAGCATGEEVYTLAILILETGLFDGWDVRVIGSDISKYSVAAARRGVYREGSFRTTTPERRAKYFVEGRDGMYVSDSVRRLCHFGQLNLVDSARASMVGRADVVFCRNVLIYFDVQSRRRVIDTLYERLVPGGYLLLGHSESLLNLSTAFELVHLREDLVYRKPLAAERWDRNAP
ncbi:MAG TPA: protein-glutamate O-methyltransferase CheR [Polyangiaceae bacterium]|nr:protein-glutamate O-methyltransferase CheR [Polyangiaceae bacterium]